MENLLNSCIVNIIDYIQCFATPHILYDHVTINQTVSPLSSKSFAYNIEITCNNMIAFLFSCFVLGLLTQFVHLKCYFESYTVPLNCWYS